MGYDLSNTMPRGQTMYNGDSIDSNNLRYGNQIGLVQTFFDINPTTGAKNSGLPVTCILLRNKIGSALLPKQAVLFSATVIGETGATVTQSATPNVFCAIVDEYLPAAGVPSNDCFWGVIKGPTTALLTTSSGTVGGQLYMPSGTDNGKLNVIDPTPDNDLAAMNQAIYALAVGIGTIASGATEGRVCLRGNWLGV